MTSCRHEASRHSPCNRKNPLQRAWAETPIFLKRSRGQGIAVSCRQVGSRVVPQEPSARPYRGRGSPAPLFPAAVQWRQPASTEVGEEGYSTLRPVWTVYSWWRGASDGHRTV